MLVWAVPSTGTEVSSRRREAGIPHAVDHDRIGACLGGGFHLGDRAGDGERLVELAFDGGRPVFDA
jgi:hypothetical protein